LDFRRWGTVSFALSATAIGALAFLDAKALGNPSPLQLLALVSAALLGVGLLFGALLDSLRRARALEGRTRELGALTQRLEQSLETLSALNTRLHQSETRYKGLVDSQGDAILRRLPDSRLTYGNEAFFKLFGLAPAATIGTPFAPILHPESPVTAFGTFGAFALSQERAKYDQRVRTAHGWRWIAWEDYAIRNGQGDLIEVQSVGRDITEQKTLEEALTDARDKAEAASHAKSNFLATMSHEIRTPMNGVLGMARLLLETKLRPEQQTYVDAIRQSGESLLSLIGDILDFSKIESGRIVLEDDEVAPRRMVEEVLELLAPRGHAKGIELVAIVVPSTPNRIRADGLRLRQILTNLVGNAVKFTERGGVRVEVRYVDKKWLRFEIRDTGVGVPADKAEEIFDEFAQADSSHARRFGGSGLGLAISKRLVAAMGGGIGVQPAPGGGSIFWFTIPAHVIEEVTTPDLKILAGRRIAIVTRNPVLRDGLSTQIRFSGGDIAPLPTKGSSAAPEIDAILIDAGTTTEPMLPALPESQVRSLVLITPNAHARLADFRALGFAAYLIKPVRLASLAERVKQTLTLPQATVAEASYRDLDGQNAPAVSAKLDRRSILLVEDNPVNAFLMRELLRRRGYELKEAGSGESALQVIGSQHFDLIVTDIHMPGLDGIEMTRRIREREAKFGRPRTPIVALTADVLETGRQACQDAGMDGFLTKPVDPAQLDSMLKAIFNVSRQPRSAA